MSNARELAELSGSYGTGGFVGMKNRIINGAMVIDQRNAGASVTPANAVTTYTLDRWGAYVNQASKLTVQQNAGSVTPPAGFKSYLGVTSSSSYSVSSGDILMVYQVVEGYNWADMAWGTADASSVTVSFWVRSSLTGTFGGALSGAASAWSYPFTYTISSANTWEKKTVTITGQTAGTWGATNGTGVIVRFSMGAGSTYLGTGNAWANTDYYGATGQTQVVGTSGATWYITGVQLEKGSTATSFDFRPYGTELALCQRYLPAFTGSGQFGGSGNAVNGTTFYATYTFAVAPRTPPTGLTINSVSNMFAGVAGITADTSLTTLSASNASNQSCLLYGVQSSATLTAGQVVTIRGNSSAIAYFTGCEL
jgi:hypothetical protein